MFIAFVGLMCPDALSSCMKHPHTYKEARGGSESHPLLVVQSSLALTTNTGLLTSANTDSLTAMAAFLVRWVWDNNNLL